MTLLLCVCCYSNIVFKAPYTVDQQPNEIIQTYLDTVGRPVVVVTKNNLVEQHIQDFEVHYPCVPHDILYLFHSPLPLSLPPPPQLTYDYESWMLLQEPLLVVVALYGFFLLIIVIVRLDFSITKVSLQLFIK